MEVNQHDDAQEKQIIVGRYFAESATDLAFETGTALDYLWEGQQGSVFEPVEALLPTQAVHQPQAEAGHSRAPVQPCLDTALKSYSNWLDTIVGE